MSTNFHLLRIADVRKESEEAISLRFEVPPALADTYRFIQGQHLTLRANIGGADVRRSYSICSGIGDGELRIAIKQVANGIFSTYANKELRAGQCIEVLPPDGRFFVPLAADNKKHYLAIVAGSGITPLLSIIKTTLEVEPNSRFTLLYGNQRRGTILFADALAALKARFMDRFAVYHFLSREAQELELFNGRLDAARLQRIFDTLLPLSNISDAFVCGPNEMIDDAIAALQQAGVARAHIHTERFCVPQGADTPRTALDDDAAQASVTVIMDGLAREVGLSAGQSILEAALSAGIDLPYSCKGGVCCTCRAKVLAGQVRMDKNFALEPAEVEQGFALTCQAHPLTENVVVSFDER